MDYCCENLMTSVERGEITYNSLRGCFWFYFKRDGTINEFGQYRLGFCPFCGAKLPKDRIDEFEEVLEKNYGIMLCDVDPNDPTTYPPEFRTDEWWKKRRL